MKKILCAGAVASLLALGGCASAVAVTPAQQVYALESQYETAQYAIISYEETPTANPAVVAKIHDLNAVAHNALVTARMKAEGGDGQGDGQDILRDWKITSAQQAVAALNAYLQSLPQMKVTK